MRARTLAGGRLTGRATRLGVAIIAAMLVLAGYSPLPSLGVAQADDSEFGDRLFVATGARGVNGQLFTADPKTAANKLVGDIKVASQPISITGLAFSPQSRVLYGSTSATSPNFAGRLVTIDPKTAAATVVGALNVPPPCVSGGGTPTLADLSFRLDGTLFGYCLNSLYRVNLNTGAASLVGTTALPGGTGAGGAGLTFTPLLNDPQSLWVAPTFLAAPAFILRINPANGATLQTVPVVDGPAGTTLGALTAESDGTILGVTLDASTPRISLLVKVDLSTGKLITRGTLPNDTDAIAMEVVERGAASVSNDDNPRKRDHNSRSPGEDVNHTEGNVVGVRCKSSDPVPELARGFIVHPEMVPYTLIGNSDDGVQQVLLIKGAAKSCDWIRVGDYLYAEGEKQSENLFYGDDVSAERR